MSTFVGTSLSRAEHRDAPSLGLAVDYGLLMVSRCREEIARGRTAEEAHRITVLTARRTALFSVCDRRGRDGDAGPDAAAVPLLGRCGRRRRSASSRRSPRSSSCPRCCRCWGRGSTRSRSGVRQSRSPTSPTAGCGWHARSARRPVVIALATTGLLLALAGPLTGTMPNRAQRPGRLVRAAVLRGDPILAPALPARHLRGGHGDRSRCRVAGCAGGRPAPALAVPAPCARRRSCTGKDIAFLNLALKDPSLDASAQEAVKAIRAMRSPPGAEILVSGTTARFIDQKQSLLHNAPVVVVAISLIIFVLMFLLTGSVIIPLKTLLMNALTLAATLGALVLAFQHGWLSGLLNYEGPEAIEVSSLRLPRRDVRLGDRLRGARHRPDQGAARPRALQRGGGREPASPVRGGSSAPRR